MDALIVKKPWIDEILSGKKSWEIRGCPTHKHGKIELIQSGSGLVVGSCEIIDCLKLDLKEYKSSSSKHCIEDTRELPYKKTYAWVIKNPCRYDTPRKYDHPHGAIIWVKL